ncbi:MAG: hypothetical protein RIG61_11860 [Deltaproteobacteria bacterium]
MKILVLFLLGVLLSILPGAGMAAADDVLEKFLTPKGADDRSNRVYPGYDFEDVIFTREYFYSLEEGTRQLRRSTTGPWKYMDLDLTPAKPEDSSNEDSLRPEGE